MPGPPSGPFSPYSPNATNPPRPPSYSKRAAPPGPLPSTPKQRAFHDPAILSNPQAKLALPRTFPASPSSSNGSPFSPPTIRGTDRPTALAVSPRPLAPGNDQARHK